MKYILSKSLEGQELVALRGNKFIKAHKFSKPVGVFTRGGERHTLTLDGEKIVTQLPFGIVTFGPVEIKAQRSNE